jgi:hypothetical protein
VASIARPTGPKEQWFVAGIYDAMRKTAGNEMQTSSEDRLSPDGTILIHKHQQAFAADGAVVLSPVTLCVKMAVGHKVFVADAARLNDCRSPKEAAFRSLHDWLHPLNAVHDGTFIHAAERVGVVKDTGKIPQRFGSLVDGGTVHCPGQPFDLNFREQNVTASDHIQPLSSVTACKKR